MKNHVHKMFKIAIVMGIISGLIIIPNQDEDHPDPVSGEGVHFNI
ncbi:hypothetical protein [Bacillus sp. NTK074B]